jgi:hypothetical protein
MEALNKRWESYNNLFPYRGMAITPSDLKASLKRKVEELGETYKGVKITKTNAPFVLPILDASEFK